MCPAVFGRVLSCLQSDNLSVVLVFSEIVDVSRAFRKRDLVILVHHSLTLGG